MTASSANVIIIILGIHKVAVRYLVNSLFPCTDSWDLTGDTVKMFASSEVDKGIKLRSDDLQLWSFYESKKTLKTAD